MVPTPRSGSGFYAACVGGTFYNFILSRTKKKKKKAVYLVLDLAVKAFTRSREMILLCSTRTICRAMTKGNAADPTRAAEPGPRVKPTRNPSQSLSPSKNAYCGLPCQVVLLFEP